MVWPCHEERGRVNAQGCDAVKGEWKEIKMRPILRWLDNIDRHQKGKNTSLKEVLRTNVSRMDKIGGHCFLDQLTGILEKILELIPGVW